MRLVVNGKEREVAASTVAELISELKLHEYTVAVELNKEIVHQQQFAKQRLQDSDVLEVVTVVGGG